jgi:hypothetical protein
MLHITSAVASPVVSDSPSALATVEKDRSNTTTRMLKNFITELIFIPSNYYKNPRLHFTGRFLICPYIYIT